MLRSLVQIFIFRSLSMSLFLNILFETDSYSNEYLLAQIGVDTAENEPLKVHLFFQPWDLIFTEPPRPSAVDAIIVDTFFLHCGGGAMFIFKSRDTARHSSDSINQSRYDSNQSIQFYVYHLQPKRNV